MNSSLGSSWTVLLKVLLTLVALSRAGLLCRSATGYTASSVKSIITPRVLYRNRLSNISPLVQHPTLLQLSSSRLRLRHVRLPKEARSGPSHRRPPQDRRKVQSESAEGVSLSEHPHNESIPSPSDANPPDRTLKFTLVGGSVMPQLPRNVLEAADVSRKRRNDWKSEI